MSRKQASEFLSARMAALSLSDEQRQTFQLLSASAQRLYGFLRTGKVRCLGSWVAAYQISAEDLSQDRRLSSDAALDEIVNLNDSELIFLAAMYPDYRGNHLRAMRQRGSLEIASSAGPALLGKIQQGRAFIKEADAKRMTSLLA